MNLKRAVAKLTLALVATGFVAAPNNLVADPILVTKQQNAIEQSTVVSAFFTQSPDNLTSFTASSGFTGPVGAGDAASTLSSGSFSIVGNSTSAGGWVDGNGVPLGITLTFNAQFTVSTPTASSFLTLGGNSGTAMGNGIGITQSAAAIGSIGVGEVLNISALSLSSINFSGTLSESGYNFTPGTVGNTLWNHLRSNNFAEGSTGATITSGADTWGFGTSTGNQGSNLIIDNNYTATGFASGGPLQFTTEAGTWNLKGIAFQYDVTYDIPAVPEPSSILLAGLGGAALLLRFYRRR